MRVTCILSGALLLGRLEMTPGVVANVREVISSSLRSWIIESLDHFGVDSRVFLHVIQSILEQDVRSLRGEDALDDLWRGQLASIGSKRGRDPKRQMNEDDLRRCVLLENMTACFKEVRGKAILTAIVSRCCLS